MGPGGSQRQSLLHYDVNEAGVIVEVVVDWVHLAREDDEFPLLSADVIGTALSQHITGDETREFIADIINAVRRLGQPRTIKYRCDAPKFKRFMQMILTPEEAGRVRITHRLIREEPLPAQIRFDAELASDSVRCSMCNRVRHDKVWREPEAALAANLLRAEHENFVIYKVCDDCRAAALGS